MKRRTQLAFDMLENEMECIATEAQLMYKGGTGEGDYGSGLWLVTGSGIWDTDIYTSGFYSSGGNYSTGSYSTGSYSTGAYGSGDAGSSGMGPEDPRQTMDGYVDANGGWENWTGGFIADVGYVGPTTTITGSTGSTGNGVMNGLEAAFSGLATSFGLTTQHIDAVTTLIDENKWITFSFKTEGNILKIIGRDAGGLDVACNIGEILEGDQTAWQNWEGVGQIALGILCVGTGGVGGLVLGAGLAAWELYEAYGEYDN